MTCIYLSQNFKIKNIFIVFMKLSINSQIYKLFKHLQFECGPSSTQGGGIMALYQMQ